MNVNDVAVVGGGWFAAMDSIALYTPLLCVCVPARAYVHMFVI